MAKISRQVQHRPERDGAKGRELADARKEVRQLKRQVSRLQKTIRKMEDERGVVIEIEEESPEPKALGAVEPDQDACSKCKGTIWTTFTTPGGKVLKACKNCKTRR